MIWTNNDVLEHIDALREAFEIIAEKAGYSSNDLISIRNKVVEERGKYGCDWDDPEEKLSFDYYYCLEQYNRLEEQGDLSDITRLRLYWFATKNAHIKELWDQAPYFDPKAFFTEQQYKDKAWKQVYKKKGKKK